MVRVLFKVGTQQQYDSLATKQAAALYFITDTQRLYKGDLLLATGKDVSDVAAGLMSPEQKAQLDALVAGNLDERLSAVEAILPKKPDALMEGAEEGSRSLLYNETQGSLLKYEHVDGTWSAMAVNNGGKDGIAAQAYAIDKDTSKGAKLDVTTKGIFYTVGDESAKPAALRDVEANEIVTRKDVSELIGVLHFRGVFEKLEDVDNPKNGDLVIVGNKEYVYVNVEGQPARWVELGDEGIYETKADAQAAYAAINAAIAAEETRAKAAEEALADSKQDNLTAGSGITLNNNVIGYDPDVLATVDYVDGSISDTILYIDQQDASEHAGRVAGDNLLQAAIDAEIARAKAAEAEKTVQHIAGTNGDSYVWNERSGGGARFVNKDGSESFIGVNDEGKDGMMAQIYADIQKDGKWSGSRINVYNDKIYYTNQAAVDGGVQRNDADHEIATIGDINAALEWEPIA